MLWVLIVTIAMSRHMFVWPTFSQTLKDACDGLDAAWRFFVGVNRYFVLDNMAAAVVRAHPTSPKLNRSFVEYAQSRGFFVDAARVRPPPARQTARREPGAVRFGSGASCDSSTR